MTCQNVPTSGLLNARGGGLWNSKIAIREAPRWFQETLPYLLPFRWTNEHVHVAARLLATPVAPARLPTFPHKKKKCPKKMSCPANVRPIYYNTAQQKKSRQTSTRTCVQPGTGTRNDEISVVPRSDLRSNTSIYRTQNEPPRSTPVMDLRA